MKTIIAVWNIIWIIAVGVAALSLFAESWTAPTGLEKTMAIGIGYLLIQSIRSEHRN